MSKSSSPLSSFNPDPFKGVTQPTFLELRDEHEEATAGAKAAGAVLRTVLEKVVAAGMPKQTFLRAIKDAEISGSEREKDALWYGQMMAWQSKPISYYQGHGDIVPVSQSVPGLKKIDTAGHEAGMQGASRDANPWSPGSEEHQRWGMAYLRGQGDRRSDPPPATRSRGRPRRDGSPAQPRSQAGGLTVVEGGTGETTPDVGPDTTETRH